MCVSVRLGPSQDTVVFSVDLDGFFFSKQKKTFGVRVSMCLIDFGDNVEADLWLVHVRLRCRQPMPLRSGVQDDTRPVVLLCFSRQGATVSERRGGKQDVKNHFEYLKVSIGRVDRRSQLHNDRKVKVSRSTDFHSQVSIFI